MSRARIGRMTAPAAFAAASARGIATLLQIGLVLAILVTIWASIWVQLEKERDRATRDAAEDAETRALALESMGRLAIGTVDRALLSAIEDYRDGRRGVRTAPPWARVSDVAGTLRLAISDPAGHLALQFGDRPLPDGMAAGCAAGSAVPDRLTIGPPHRDPSAGGQYIAFSRPVLTAGGTCMGTVAAAVSAELFDNAARAIGSDHSLILLVGLDGLVRAGMPKALLTGSTAPRALSAILTGPVSGKFRLAETPSVGGPGTVAYRRFPDLPLIAAASISETDMMSAYRADRFEYGLIGIALSGLVLGTGILLLALRARMIRFQNALAATLDNMSQGLVMIDERRRMRVLNRRFVELLEVPEHLARRDASFDDLLRWQIDTDALINPESQDRAARLLTGELKLDSDLPVYERTRRDGIELEVRTALLANGAAVRTYTDITEHKRTERALAAARDAAEAAGRARSDFLAVMSHEIRTPLNGIIGMAGLLLDMDRPEEERGYLEVIRTSGDHLLELVNDILDCSRLDAGRLELEEVVFELPATIENAVHLLAAQARAKGLLLRCETAGDLPRWAVGDPARLRQILLNLVGNAVKFTPEGEIRIDASVAAEEPGAARIAIAVSDTGIGIPPEAVGRLFHAFTQVDNSISRRFGGSGLGLAICRRLAERMGGSIAVDSTPGRGSTFRFDIRVKPASAPVTAAGPAAPTPPKRRLRVLVTEDNGTNRLVAARMLERMGHRVDTVADGEEALRALRSIPYDLVLMDVMMPGMDGLTATRAIRAGRWAAARTPIVGLTANAQPADEQACRDAGMDGFVTKPVTAERLAAAIEAATAAPIEPAEIAECEVSRRVVPTVTMTGPERPVVDEAFLAGLAEDIGIDGAIEAIDLFREDAPARIATMRAAVDCDPARVRREAHALAGAARSVALVPLGEAASALQHAIETMEPDPAAVEHLAALVKESLAALGAWKARC